MENLFQQNIPLKSENAYQKYVMYRAFTSPETFKYFFFSDEYGALFDDIGLGDVFRDYHEALTQEREKSCKDGSLEGEMPSFIRQRRAEESCDLFSNNYKQLVYQVIEEFLTDNPIAPADESVIGDNVRTLYTALNLSDAESAILLFYVHLDCNRYFDKVIPKLPSAPSENKKMLNLAVITGIPQQEVADVFSQQGKLFSSGLLERKSGIRGIRSEEFVPEYEIPSEFRNRICVPNASIIELVNHVFEDAQKPECSAQDFTYVPEYNALLSLIRGAVKHKEKGVNILIYGAPGTGKTTLANVLLREAGLAPKFVKYKDKYGESLSPVQRLKYFNICQQTLSVKNDTGLIFDEASDVFSPGSGGLFISVSSPISKNHVHSSLENNLLPTIFLCNDIDRFDEATLSRFFRNVKMPELTEKARLNMLEKSIPKQQIGAVSNTWLQELSTNKAITPRHVANSFKVASITDKKGDSFQQTVSEVIDNYLFHLPKSQSQYKLPKFYQPSFIQCHYSPAQLVERFRDCSNLSVLFHGLPGTGKTAFAVYLLEQANISYDLVKASDVYNAYVGETEKKIAALFRDATHHKRALVFDEVDSLVSARQGMQHAWQRTMVNQFLQELETHQGLVFATTNFIDNLDPAVLRRFSAKIELFPIALDKKTALLREVAKHHSLSIDVNEEHLSNVLQSLEPLTPGDFNAVNGRLEWLNINKVSQYLNELRAEVEVKSTKKQIGFITNNNSLTH